MSERGRNGDAETARLPVNAQLVVELALETERWEKQRREVGLPEEGSLTEGNAHEQLGQMLTDMGVITTGDEGGLFFEETTEKKNKRTEDFERNRHVSPHALGIPLRQFIDAVLRSLTAQSGKLFCDPDLQIGVGDTLDQIVEKVRKALLRKGFSVVQ